jgi:hypothetical protein
MLFDANPKFWRGNTAFLFLLISWPEPPLPGKVMILPLFKQP